MSAPTVLILAAGQGTRMRSSTPKVLHEICGRPMVLWPVQAAREALAARVVVVDSPGRPLREALPEDLQVVVQERPDGTGGAVRAAIEQIGSELDAGAPVLVLAGDVPLIDANTIRELVAVHEQQGAAATMVTTILADPSGYGRVVRDADGEVQRVVETKRPGDSTQAEREIREINTGVFAFAPHALRQVLPRLSDENSQGELYLPQALELLRGDGARVVGHQIEDVGLVLGINDRVALAQVRAIAQESIHERHMLAGVTIVDPTSTVIDVDVQIGQDTTIEPFSTLRGRTSVGGGCLIRQSYLQDATLEDGVTVGPFAYLRPGAVLRAGSKVGTFVEVKNSDIGPGAKVPHLSYLGDADVGEGSNLGAATITANYDGRAKHRTKIGVRVRTGVDTTLVAPVTLGDEAVTGAGSVITEEIPGAALGIARERQVNIEGYAHREAEESEAGQEGGRGA